MLIQSHLFDAARKLAGRIQFQIVHAVQGEMLGQFPTEIKKDNAFKMYKVNQ
jgi:hypothetical protein